MTPKEFQAIRKRKGLSCERLARILRLSSGRTVRRYEDGDRPISPTIELLMQLIDVDAIPDGFMVA